MQSYSNPPSRNPSRAAAAPAPAPAPAAPMRKPGGPCAVKPGKV